MLKRRSKLRQSASDSEGRGCSTVCLTVQRGDPDGRSPCVTARKCLAPSLAGSNSDSVLDYKTARSENKPPHNTDNEAARVGEKKKTTTTKGAKKAKKAGTGATSGLFTRDNQPPKTSR